MNTLNDILIALQAGHFAALLQALVFLSTVCLIFGGALWLFGGNPVARRLREVKEGPHEAAKEPHKEGGFDVRWIEPVAKVLMPREDWRISRLRKRLVLAGFRSNSALYLFVTSKAAVALALVLAAAPLWIRSFDLFESRPFAVATLVVIALIGFYAPDLYLHHRRKERQRTFVEGFPDAMDLLVVCVEAGLGLDAAIARVGKEMASSHPEFAEELTIVSLEMRAGKSREEALRALGDRTGIPQIQSLVALLVQAEHFGTSIATALSEHAAEMRQLRLQQAKEKAAKLPVKLIFPIIFFIFPALFLVILGPAAVRIYLGFIAGDF